MAAGGSDVIFNTLLTHNWGNIVDNSHNFNSINWVIKNILKTLHKKVERNLGIIIIIGKSYNPFLP